MVDKANWLLFSIEFMWILFAFGKASMFTTFHTQEGCNATLLCNQPGNVTWLNYSDGQKIEGPRFTTLAYGPFSTLVMTVVSKNDKGNITCLGHERNITINLEVCSDNRETQNCLDQIAIQPTSCNDGFMIRECKKSCKLCPDCQETVLPTLPPSTGNATKPTTESVSSPSTPDLSLRGSGVSWSSGFQALFALFFGLFSILGVFFQN